MELEHEANLLVTESGQFLLLQVAHFYPIDDHRTAVRLVQRSHNLQKSSLSGSTRSHYTYHFSFIYNKVYPFQDLKFAETLGYTLNFYHLILSHLLLLLSSSTCIPISTHGHRSDFPTGHADWRT